MIGPVGSTQRTGWMEARRPAPSPEGRAVVVPAGPAFTMGAVRGAAQAASPYLVQLIAARDGFPQARERRRAEPAEGIRAYRSTGERLGAVRLGPAPELAVA